MKQHHRIKHHHHRRQPMLEEDAADVVSRRGHSPTPEGKTSIVQGDYNDPFPTYNAFNIHDDDIHEFYNSHPVGISYNKATNNETQDYYNQHTTREEGGLSSSRIRPMEEAHDDSNFSRLSDIYTSDFGKQFRIVERDKDGNPTAIREMKGTGADWLMGDRVYRARSDGKFMVDSLSDEQKDQVHAFNDGVADVYKTVGKVASGISTAYGAYQGIKAGYEGIKSLVDKYNNIPDEDVDAYVEEELNEEALPTEEELTTAEEQAEEIFAEADEDFPTIEEIGNSMVERFSSLYPDYSYSGSNYDDYQEVDKEDYDEYEEVAADEAKAEPLVEGEAVAATEAETAVESTSWWEAAIDVVEGVGEVMVELAPLGI